MIKIMMSALVSTTLSLSMMIICTIISKSSIMDREKMSPFECGFDPLSSARTPFSIQFFLIAVLFLIFDIEIAIMLPIILTMKNSMTMMWMIVVTMFITTLILGLYHEWKNGMLEWAK
uniref:NADH-ubiquinone oxidoreductase chain 3 n=1 Tax=Mattiphus splendidus TaxID=1603602 RepID=A0A7M1IC94_9HEMI|nr:NADH dehydrogenase subunit 3 [Mattiphus splendidus]QOQ37007.1 NADH dehydrogenase subunit 3 [Mattiphus splendidus]